MTEDAALMTRIQGGDATAYRELSERHIAGILNFAFRMLRDRQEAEDVTQETFLRLWKRAHDYQAKQKPSTWLYTIARNLCIDRLRKKHPQGSDDEVAADSVSPNRMLERKHVSSLVRGAIQALPERQQTALTLSHFEGLSNPEIGEVLGVKVEAVESLLSRARRKLRTELAELRTAGVEV